MSNSLFRALGAAQDAATKVLYGKEQKISKTAFTELVDRNMNGEEVKMSGFVGDVLLLVNVASK
jgi:hypothetical protein